MHKKPIYGGRINSDHGNRRGNTGAFPEMETARPGYTAEPRNDMDLFLHTRPLVLIVQL